MPQNQVYTSPLPTTSLPSGVQNQQGGKLGEAWIADLHGKYYTYMKNGNVFSASCVPTGLAIPIYTSTTMAFTLWNPLGSGVDIIPLRFDASYVSGTGVVSGFGFGYYTGMGANIGTGAPVITFTALTSPNIQTNSYLGGSAAKTMVGKIASASTYAVAPSILRAAGFGQQAPVSAGTSIWSGTFVEFDGSVGVGPGSILVPVATAASGDLFWQSFMWAEVPQ